MERCLVSEIVNKYYSDFCTKINALAVSIHLKNLSDHDRRELVAKWNVHPTQAAADFIQIVKNKISMPDLLSALRIEHYHDLAEKVETEYNSRLGRSRVPREQVEQQRTQAPLLTYHSQLGPAENEQPSQHEARVSLATSAPLQLPSHSIATTCQSTMGNATQDNNRTTASGQARSSTRTLTSNATQIYSRHEAESCTVTPPNPRYCGPQALRSNSTQTSNSLSAADHIHSSFHIHTENLILQYGDDNQVQFNGHSGSGGNNDDDNSMSLASDNSLSSDDQQ